MTFCGKERRIQRAIRHRRSKKKSKKKQAVIYRFEFHLSVLCNFFEFDDKCSIKSPTPKTSLPGECECMSDLAVGLLWEDLGRHPQL